MAEFRWSPLESQRLKRARGVSFDEIIEAKLVGTKDNPKREHQQLMLFEYKNYIWLVPCVREGDVVFLKTLYPSRKYTRIYRKRGSKNEED